MSLMELIRDALATLWRQKLRSALTVGGVVVAIGALVTLLSFASGMSKNVQDQVEKFRLLQTMTVTATNSDSAAVLDSTALRWMESLPGVMQAYPESPFPVRVIFGEDTTSSEAQAFPPNARGSLLFEHIAAGEVYQVGDTSSVLITSALLDRMDIEDPDSLVGQSLILYSEHGHPDSGYAAITDTLLHTPLSSLPQMVGMFQQGEVDSLVGRLLGTAASAFFEGYMTRVDTVRDTLIVSGVVDVGEGWNSRLRPLVLPVESTRRLDPGSFTSNPLSMLSSFQSGNLFNTELMGGTGIDKVTLELAIEADHEALRDSLDTRGFESDDFLEFYSEFRKMIMLFTAGMSMLGFIALFIAALGIVNTMVMSILERRREIGILKSLGAEDKDIRILFLVESGTIGLVGSALGLLLGWVVSETIGFAMQLYMEQQGVGDMDLFYIGPDTVLIAIGFGLIVSTVAGLYPASRAAQLDPVVALREE
jgi:putative ABC transport system permease protein